MEVSPVVGSVLNAIIAPSSFAGTGVISILDSGGNTVATSLFDSGPAHISVTATDTSYTVQIVAIAPSTGQLLSIYASTKADTNITLPYDQTDSFGAQDIHAYHFTAQDGAQYRVSLTPPVGLTGNMVVTGSRVANRSSERCR